MRRFVTTTILILLFLLSAAAQNVTVKAVNQPAEAVFKSVMKQTGKNFLYPSGLLDGINVTVSLKDTPLKKALSEIFSSTDIEYKIKGNNVILKRKPKRTKTNNRSVTPHPAPATSAATPDVRILDELVVVSRLEAPEVTTAEIGARKITADEVRDIPVIFGEADVIKALQMQPGVSEGSEGMAGMHVHGGDADGNLYMLDNVPVYQVNHFGGLFSAFNTDIIRYIDFFKSSVPAKYDGRLSSFMDVRLLNGNRDGHHGSARLGLTSGAFNISGPIGARTTYLVGLRRSWYDVLSIPMLAIINSKQEEKTRFHYYFMDLNAKVNHRFSDKANGFASIYFGDDMLKTGTDYDDQIDTRDKERYDFHWGNLIAQAGLNYRFNQGLSAEFTAAYTRYFTSLKNHDEYTVATEGSIFSEEETVNTSNNINDWIFRGDFDWQPDGRQRVRFGAGYVRHSFLPARTSRTSIVGSLTTQTSDSTRTYGANEVNAYIEDDWRITDHLRINGGLHASLFNIGGKVKWGISPRVSVSWHPVEAFALKGAYTRTVQYVHQLSQSYLSLPTDQWIPVTGDFKPQTADKISVGGYWQSADGGWSASVEGYWKWMHNLLDYRDEYYLRPPLEMWDARLTSGRGSAKGIDFELRKLTGKVTGQVSYSLGRVDRTFADKNGGRTYPARSDHRHTINVVVNWHVSDKVQLNAAWTGHSGNRFTLLPQRWEAPEFSGAQGYYPGDAPLRTTVNNYQLPFYHRLDLSCTVRNSRGYWTFGLYNAYNHMNVVAVRGGYRDETEVTPDHIIYTSRPVFQKVKLLPVIPSISYTWEF